MVSMKSLLAIRYSRGFLELLDQRRLPLETEWITIANAEQGFTAIKDMATRGAPAIAIAAVLAVAVDLTNAGGGRQFESAQQAEKYIRDALFYLLKSRPTAVNLSEAVHKLSSLTEKAAKAPGATSSSVVGEYVKAAEAYFEQDVETNKAMGQHGAKAVLAAVQARGKVGGPVRMLTHCNTGSLATAAYGTALGVIRALSEAGQLEHAYCTETRPYNQGARLTAYELVHDGLPATLLADSAAAALMAKGKVDAVVVGADRVAANGDTANKIGTYSLAVNAARHNIPFFVAAPTTTLDAALPDGSGIPIEQRPEEEVTHMKGQRIAAEGIEVWNPSFDVTPADLIEGVVTERGVIPKQAGAFQVRAFLREAGLLAPGEQANGTEAHAHVSSIPGFEALNVETVKDYLAERPALARLVGNAESRSSWSVREVGDGNINFVYIVEGPAGALCVKQGLPYIRIVESWALDQERVRFEAEALREQARHAPGHVPIVHHYDTRMALIVMQYLAPPHVILRKALVHEGAIYPRLADHISTFAAATLFRTSLLALPAEQWRAAAQRFRNDDMCRLTERVIFTEPYFEAEVNRHTSPQLDDIVAQLRGDPQIKRAITSLKAKFMSQPQALLHGDLHTGSLMVTPDTTYAIDAEFAFYGPIAFDIGKFIANLLLAYFAADGHATDDKPRMEQKMWLLQAASKVWQQFRAKFLALWDAEGTGELCPPELFGKAATKGLESRQAAQEAFFAELEADALGFGAAVIIRRILGIAHVEDLEAIADADTRAKCERKALEFAARVLTHPIRTYEIAVQSAQMGKPLH